MTKPSDQTIKMISQLSREIRAKVDKVIRTHVEACMKNGSPVENLDRLFIEAVEVVKLEERLQEPKMDFRINSEPFRRYDQYSSPRDV
ncbi:MAG: hypothetical protein L0226_17000 [Acidobacteria bacterium]|nr:hypothetical protein [Acidobacteriota bacterium]